MLRVLKQAELSPGTEVWLENHRGLSTHANISHARIDEITDERVYLVCDGKRYRTVEETMDYNVQDHWRCWSEKPDSETAGIAPWATAEELSVGPEGKSCGSCFRRHWISRGCYKCRAYYSPKRDANFTKAEPACRFYLSEAEEHKKAREGRKRIAARRARIMEEAAASPPLPPYWKSYPDPFSSYVSPPIPHCPICEDMMAGPDSICPECGAKIIVDAKLKNFFKPAEIQRKDCFHCGGKGTFEYTRSVFNNHMHGFCTAWGAVVME